MLDLGLLFDVDGPLASPVSRSIRIPSILQDLVALTAAGVPIAFITGRSDAFIRDQVVGPLLDAGLDDALQVPGARMFGVFEKGGSWAPITSEGLGEVSVNQSVALPVAVVDGIRTLVADGFADTMFFDGTKRVMISVEQRTDVTSETYLRAQSGFNDACFALMAAAGLGIRFGVRSVPDASGSVPFRLEPTIISTDIESVLLDKDAGAKRALKYFAGLGELPTTWRSIGDSHGDYLMADHLHDAGFEVAHVDVWPLAGLPERPYPVIVEGDSLYDEAGAAFLGHWARKLTAQSAHGEHGSVRPAAPIDSTPATN